MPRFSRQGRKFHIWSDEGVEAHLAGLTTSIHQSTAKYFEHDVRIHCKNKVIIGSSKILLGCASEFLRSLFTSKCECYEVHSMTFDLVCPTLEPEAVTKVLDMIAGQVIIINEANKVLYRQICLVIDLLKIKIDLPVCTEPSFLMDTPVEITIDDDPSDLIVDAEASALNSTALDDTMIADENENDEEESEVATGAQPTFNCLFCSQVFTTSTALDIHVKVHIYPQSSESVTPPEPLPASEPRPAIAVKEEAETPTTTDILKCDSCDKVFTLTFTLEQHRKKHLGPTEQSENEGRTRVNTELVLDTTSMPPPGVVSKMEDHFFCDQCQESFSEMSLFEAHVETHTRRPDERSSESSNPRQSQASGSKTVYLYRCHICKQSMTRYLTLALHIGRQHLGSELKKFYDQNNPLNCQLCRKVMPTTAGLDAHLISYHEVFKKLIPPKNELRVEADAGAGHSGDTTEGSSGTQPEAEPVRLSKQLKCPFCSVEASDSVNLLKHVAREHYRAELQAMYEPGTDWKCKECKTAFDDEDSLINHLMSVHKALNKLLVMVGRQRAINEAQNKARSSVSEPSNDKSSEASTSSSNSVYKCSNCNMSSSSYFSLLMHLAYSHYKQEIFNLMGDSKTDCKFCLKVFARRQGLFSHVAATHAIDEGILPPKSQFDSPSNEGRDSITEKPSDNNESDRGNGAPPAVRVYKCPSCKKEFGSYKKLLGHVARSHFKMELLQMHARNGSKDYCENCDRLLASNEDDLVKHLAQDHDKLDGFLPSKESFIASNDQEFKSCQDCGKFFDQESSLDEHRKSCKSAKKSGSSADKQNTPGPRNIAPKSQLGPKSKRQRLSN